MFVILFFSTFLHAQTFDCGANLKYIAPNRPIFGVSEGKLVELERVQRQIKKVSVMVPVYRELANGNLPRLMQILRGQTLNPRLLEVVLVVNNSQSSAARADSVFAENQATLSWLSRQQYPFTLKILDLSSTGVEPNMGYLRQAGAQAALDQSVPLDQHVLVFMDADTEFKPDHLSRLVQVYRTLAVDVVLSRLQLEVRDRNHLELNLGQHAYRTTYTYGMFQRALRSAQDGVGAPQVSALARGFRAVGGFPLVEKAEDLGLVQKFAPLKMFYAPDLFVVAEDRARADGFDAAHRAEWNEDFDWSSLSTPPPRRFILRDLLKPLKDKQVELISRRRVSPYTATLQLAKEIALATGVETPALIHPEIFAHHELKNHPAFDTWAMDQIFDFVFEALSIDPGELSLSVFANLLDRPANRKINADIQRRADAHDNAVFLRHKFLTKWYRGLDLECDSKDLFVQLFCAPSSKLRDFFTQINLERADEDDFMEYVVDLFPDHLDFWDNTFHLRENVMFELSETYLLSGYHDPDRYPGFQRFFR